MSEEIKNRKINFRVWNIMSKKFHYIKNLDLYKSKHEILMESVGIRDVDNCLIYEGDIVKNKSGKMFQVTWHSDTLYIGWQLANIGGDGNFEYHQWKDLKIISNLFEYYKTYPEDLNVKTSKKTVYKIVRYIDNQYHSSIMSDSKYSLIYIPNQIILPKVGYIYAYKDFEKAYSAFHSVGWQYGKDLYQIWECEADVLDIDASYGNLNNIESYWEWHKNMVNNHLDECHIYFNYDRCSYLCANIKLLKRLVVSNNHTITKEYYNE